MSTYLLGWPKDKSVSSFFVCKRIIVEEMKKYVHPFPYLSGLVLRVTRKIGEVEVHQRERSEGVSGYSFLKLLSLWVNGFTAFSIKPLRIATFLGFAIALIGFIYGLVLLIRKITISTVLIGYSSIMVGLLVIGGVIMIMLGLIGEYIGRIYICMNNSPQYVIREILENNETTD